MSCQRTPPKASFCVKNGTEWLVDMFLDNGMVKKALGNLYFKLNGLEKVKG